MEAIQIKSTNDELTIKVNKSKINMDIIIDFLERLRVEFLAQKINFDEEILTVSDEIKEDWWKRNKEKFLMRAE